MTKRICIAAALLAIMIFGTFYDLNVSLYLTEHAPYWLIRIAEYLTVITPCILMFCGIYLFRHAERWQRYLGGAVGIASPIVFGVSIDQSTVPVLIFLTVMSLITAVIAWKAPYDKRMIRCAWAGMILIGINLITVNGIKFLWGRPRFLYMTDPQTQFRPWYIIAGPHYYSDAYRSFPSSHTVSASSSLWLLYLGFLYPDHPEYKVYTGILCAFVVIFTAVSRIAAGMHFVTDVTAGFSIGLFWFEMIRKFVVEKDEKAVE